MSDPRRSRAGLGLALAAALVSGIAVYVNGRAVRHFPSPTVYTTAKNLVAGVLLVAVAAAYGRRVVSSGSQRAEHGRFTTPATLLAIAVIGGAVPFVLFFEGLARASSSDAAFIHKTLVVWAAVLAVVVLRERMTALHLGAIALLVGGHAVLTGGIASLRPGTGEAMIFGATLCWSVEVVLVRRITRTVPAADVAAARLAGGSVLLVGWVALRGDVGELTSLSGTQWAWIAATGPILATFVTLWFAALERAQVLDVTSILVLGAVVTGLLNTTLGTGPAEIRYTGYGLILAGVVVVIAEARRQLAPGPRWT